MNTTVNFKIAKLLKEKGYDKRSEPYKYNKDGELTLLEGLNAPTIAEAVMWIYGKYNIWISVQKDWDIGLCLGFEAIIDVNDGFINTETFIMPKEAYESAIKYTLEEQV